MVACAEKEAAIKAQDFEKAAALRDKEKQTKEKLDTILTKWREEREEKEVLVTADDMMHIIAKVTGVPLQRMEQAETEKLLQMDKALGGISRISFQMSVAALRHDKLMHAIELLGTRLAPIIRKALP